MKKKDLNKVIFVCLEGTELPKKATELSGAVDLQARGVMQWYKEDNTKVDDLFLERCNTEFKEGKSILLMKGQRILIDTGLQLAYGSRGFKGNIRPRSGLALKHGITVLNSPGLIDEDYRDKVGVILVNTSTEPFKIELNDRIAQMEVSFGEDFEILETDEVVESESSRKGGFGSTGISDDSIIWKYDIVESFNDVPNVSKDKSREKTVLFVRNIFKRKREDYFKDLFVKNPTTVLTRYRFEDFEEDEERIIYENWFGENKANPQIILIKD